MAQLKVMHQMPLQPLHSFASEHTGACVVELNAAEQIGELLATIPHLPQPLKVLGSGSNIVFADDFSGTILLNRMKGYRLLRKDVKRQVQLWRVWGGEIWHDWVENSVDLGLSGIENLALIPGTVGAAPIQNIGAYGVELATSLVGLTALNLVSGQVRFFTNEACQFGYRDSFFKIPDNKHEWLIISVDFELSEVFYPCLNYPTLKQHCAYADHPRQVFEAVCQVRRSRLPDPAILPNAGSFFKNPLVTQAEAIQCQSLLPQIPVHPLDEKVKLSAAYLIEAAGLKGLVWEEVGVSDQHALVLVRRQPGSGEKILSLAKYIQQSVFEKFKVKLEIEPQTWPEF